MYSMRVVNVSHVDACMGGHGPARGRIRSCPPIAQESDVHVDKHAWLTACMLCTSCTSTAACATVDAALVCTLSGFHGSRTHHKRIVTHRRSRQLANVFHTDVGLGSHAVAGGRQESLVWHGVHSERLPRLTSASIMCMHMQRIQHTCCASVAP